MVRDVQCTLLDDEDEGRGRRKNGRGNKEEEKKERRRRRKREERGRREEKQNKTKKNNTTKSTCGHIIFKLQNIKNKEKIWKGARGKNFLPIEEQRITYYFFSETMQVRRE